MLVLVGLLASSLTRHALVEFCEQTEPRKELKEVVNFDTGVRWISKGNKGLKAAAFDLFGRCKVLVANVGSMVCGKESAAWKGRGNR